MAAAGINVIIVGAGFGGLASAIEFARKGAKVTVFESVAELTKLGDVIMIGSNATRILSKWADVLPRLEAVAAQPEVMVIHDQHGKVLLRQPMPAECESFPNLYTNRGMAQRLMYEHAIGLGVAVKFGAKISEYFEKEDSAGIVIDGERHSADLIIAADGVHSRARAFITGVQERPQRSGFAVYRSWFDLKELKDGNPKTDWIKNAKKDLMEIWIGEDTHSVIMVNFKLQTMTCFATHKDTYDVKESWGVPGKVEDMLAVVDGWDTTLSEVIKQIPPSVLIDWKLLWRDPVKQWRSDGGRVVLVGDAAHPHLATSGTGGAQAIEGGATLAALADITGSKNIPLATEAYQRLRFERTSITQRMGWETRHRWHQTDWEALATNPDILKLPQPLWLNGHDAEQYAYNNYKAALANLESGTPFVSTNVPEGYVHEDWSIADMMAMEGQKVGDDFYVVDNTDTY